MNEGLPDQGRDAPTLAQLTLVPLLTLLKPYRRFFGGMVLAITAVSFGGGIVFFLAQDRVDRATVPFSLTFEGAEDGKYPNGMPFTTADIVAEPVVSAVYEQNALDTYCPVGVLRSGVFVLESSVELEMLDSEYRSRLAVTSLSPVERARLEAEYRQKRQGMRHRDYQLVFVRPPRCERLPRALMQKVLNDLLATWATQAVTLRGVVSYDFGVASPQSLAASVGGTKSSVVRLDLLRGFVGRALDAVDALLELPGSSAFRAPNKMSLVEIRMALSDLQRHRIEPLTRSAVSATGPSDTVTIDYIRDRVFRSRLQRESDERQVAILQQALRDFVNPLAVRAAASAEVGRPADQSSSTLMPQLGDTFLDRLMDLANESQASEVKRDLTNRIILQASAAERVRNEENYYSVLLETALAGRRGGADQANLLVETAAVEKVLADMLGELHAVYEALSSANLNPRGVLYSVSGPYSVRSDRAYSPIRVLSFALALWIACVVVVVLVVLGHAKWFRRSSPPPPVSGVRA